MWYIIIGAGLVLFGINKVRPKKKKGYEVFSQSSKWHHERQRNSKKYANSTSPYIGV